MLKDTTLCLLLSFFIPLGTHALTADQKIIESAIAHQEHGFANLEHRQLGDRIQLQWAGLAHHAEANKLHLPNGLQLSYGEIVYLAGDMIGDPSCSISSESPDGREACFHRQFAALAENDDPVDCHSPITRIPVYREYFTALAKSIKRANAQGQDTTDYYHEHSKRITFDLNRLSCGGSVISALFPFGHYIQLAEINFDHFPPDAITAYKTGHRIAIQRALKARAYYQGGKLEKAEHSLQLAYAQNAYANHYLTDGMSSGHMRVPRRELDRTLFLPAALNLLIANIMHDEDNRLGLNVHNKLGQHWHAYGDGMLHQPKAATHRQMIVTVMQESADAIFQVFSTGKTPIAYKELDLIPVYDEIWRNQNHAPLFKVENNHVLKRKDNFNPHDFRYTRWWNGMLTLLSH